MHNLIYAFILSSLLMIYTNHKPQLIESLNGTWIPVKEEMNGAALPKESFAKQKMVIEDTAYTVYAESIDKGIVRYTDTKMDIFGKDGVNVGKHFTAIYKLSDGLLSVCYNLSGDVYPETFDTKGKPGFFLAVFKRSTD